MKTFFPPILILLPMRTSHSSGSTFFDLRQTITTVKTIRHLPPLSKRFEQSPKITNTTCSFYILQPGSSHPPLGWVRGPGRHGGEAPALCDGSDDVGLDSLFLSHQGERKKNLLPLHHPPHQFRKHLPRAALHKLRHAVGEHVLHALRPTDGGEE